MFSIFANVKRCEYYTLLNRTNINSIKTLQNAKNYIFIKDLNP